MYFADGQAKVPFCRVQTNEDEIIVMDRRRENLWPWGFSPA